MSNQKQYDDTNTGIIGKNDYKEKDSHPDIRGRVNVDGLWYWVSGWEKNVNGREFTSLALTLMTQDQVDKMLAKRAEKQRPQQRAQGQQSQPQQQQQTQQQYTGPEPTQDYDDDIPF